jgi:hypothetical protein
MVSEVNETECSILRLARGKVRLALKREGIDEARGGRAHPGGNLRLSLTWKPGNCSKMRKWVSPL